MKATNNVIHDLKLGIIAGEELHQLVADGVITGLLSNDQINAASIDVTLADVILEEPVIGPLFAVSLAKRDAIPFVERRFTNSNYALPPGKFILASTNEIFNLPDDISAQYICKSSMARIGLNHLHAGWCDAGWHGSSLTMEFQNVTNRTHILLDHNCKVGQMVFHRHAKVPSQQSYALKGSYNGTIGTTATKPEAATATANVTSPAQMAKEAAAKAADIRAKAAAKAGK